MGADGVNGSLKLEILVRHMPPSPYLQAVLAKLMVEAQFTSADGDRAYYVEDATIAGAATTNIDLDAVTDAYGSALTATEVVLMAIVADADNPDDIEIKPGAATGWIGLFEAGSVLNLRPGNAIFISALGTSIPVTAGSKIMALLNTDGADPVTYSLLVVTKD